MDIYKAYVERKTRSIGWAKRKWRHRMDGSRGTRLCAKIDPDYRDTVEAWCRARSTYLYAFIDYRSNFVSGNEEFGRIAVAGLKDLAKCEPKLSDYDFESTMDKAEEVERWGFPDDRRTLERGESTMSALRFDHLLWDGTWWRRPQPHSPSDVVEAAAEIGR